MDQPAKHKYFLAHILGFMDWSVQLKDPNWKSEARSAWGTTKKKVE